VVDERRPGRVQVRGVELDPGEGGARAQSRQLVLPLRAHVAAKVVERDQLAQPIDRGRAALRTDQQLASRPDDGLRNRHHGALVFGVEQAQRLNGLARPLGAHRRVGRRRKHVEDSPTQRELSALLDQRLACVAQLDQPGGHGHRVRPLPGLQHQRAFHQVAPADRLPRDRAPGGDHYHRLRASQCGQGLEAAVHRLVKGRRAVEEGDGDLGKNIGRWVPREPQPQLIREAVGPRNQDEDGSAAVHHSPSD